MSKLREAAQAVLDRWDSPAWEWLKQGPTAALMADLRAALVEPTVPSNCADSHQPLTIERLRDALVASRIIPPAAVEDPDEYDDGVTLFRIEALHRRIT